MKGYPRNFLPALLGTVLLVFASGLLLVPNTLAIRVDVDLGWQVGGAGRVWTAALHAAAGFAAMLLVGALWSVHMRTGWRRRQHRASGLLVGLLFVLLAVTAVAVYYVGDEGLGTAAALLHLLLGGLLAGAFGWHWLRGRRKRLRGR